MAATSYLPPTLDSLPFDVFYMIATLIDDRDYIYLSRTNRAIHNLMKNDLIEWKTVKNFLAYSKEGQSALVAGSGYRQAVGHRFGVHEALATASPYAVAMLAYAVDFLYHQGVLCYCVGHEIRMLNVHGGARQEQALNLDKLITSQRDMLDPASRVELIHYSDGILVFRLLGLGSQGDDTLVAIDMIQQPTHCRRLLLQLSIPSHAPIFVRHSRSYLWYGVYAEAPDTAEVRSCYGVDLATAEKIDFHLDQVVNGELGRTFCLDIYQDYLYVISTQVTPENDDPFSSFYHWFCYAPRQKGRKWSGKLWRREHREGRIKMMSTDISIHKDESTGRPMIVEIRREWLGGNSEHQRTTYIEPLATPAELHAAHPNGDIKPPMGIGESSSGEGSSKDLVIDEAYDHWPEKRLPRNYHAEHELSDDPSERQGLIYAYTTYDPASSTFVDLVKEIVGPADSPYVQKRLRLRTISRKRKCPIGRRHH